MEKYEEENEKKKRWNQREEGKCYDILYYFYKTKYYTIMLVREFYAMHMCNKKDDKQTKNSITNANRQNSVIYRWNMVQIL